MDREFRNFARKQTIELVSAEEIITRRVRAGVCPLCARSYEDRCPCIGSYVYIDENELFRLRRDRRSTLPCGIVTGVVERAFKVLIFSAAAFDRIEGEIISKKKDPSREKDIKFEDIVDLDVAVLDGVDIDEAEKRMLSDYITALEQSGDLYSAGK
jgi:hypothetical protein